MQIHESAEDYLESVLILSKQLGNVRSIDIVNYFDYSKPSISVAMKNLRMNGYVTVDSKGYIELTEKGSEIANKMYERHTLLTKWLTALGVDEKIAVEDACRIEHVISEESFEAIKKHIPANQNKYSAALSALYLCVSICVYPYIIRLLMGIKGIWTRFAAYHKTNRKQGGGVL